MQTVITVIVINLDQSIHAARILFLMSYELEKYAILKKNISSLLLLIQYVFHTFPV